MPHKKTVDATTLLSRADESHCFELYEDLRPPYNYSPHPVRTKTDKTGKTGEVIDHKEEGESFIDYSIPPLDSAAIEGVWGEYEKGLEDIKKPNDRGSSREGDGKKKNTVSIDKKCKFCPLCWLIKKFQKKKSKEI